MLTFDPRSRAVDTAQELFDGDDSAINIDETYAMEIENGEGINGYQYLHGTNADAGGATLGISEPISGNRAILKPNGSQKPTRRAMCPLLII